MSLSPADLEEATEKPRRVASRSPDRQRWTGVRRVVNSLTRVHPGRRHVRVTDVFRNQEEWARERDMRLGADSGLWQASTCPWFLSFSVAPHEAAAGSYGHRFLQTERSIGSWDMLSCSPTHTHAHVRTLTCTHTPPSRRGKQKGSGVFQPDSTLQLVDPGRTRSSFCSVEPGKAEYPPSLDTASGRVNRSIRLKMRESALKKL